MIKEVKLKQKILLNQEANHFNIMRNFLLYTFLLLSLEGCSDSYHKEMVRALSNDSSKYWYRYYQDTLRPYSLGYRIFKDGTFIRYYNPGGNKKSRIIDDTPPVHSKPYWKLIDDSTIMFGEGDYNKIVFLNADSVILQGLKSNTDHYLKLHRDNDQITEPHH